MPALKTTIKRLMPDALKPRWRRCYSQEGEDMVLVALFGDAFKGLYVDIGAHDPLMWSNTIKLAERGWRGLNIDPRPGLAGKFRKRRPQDKCLEVAIDIGSRQPLQYWMFDSEPRWNCLSPTEPTALRDGRPVRPTSHFPVPIITIAEALDQANLERVDLVNIDIEGGEEYILRHWPWDRYAPKAICVEVVGKPAAEIANSELTRFLAQNGMVFTSQLVCSAIYLERGFLATRYPTDPDGTHFQRACLHEHATA
jgi:FkbM family methyltransferase